MFKPTKSVFKELSAFGVSIVVRVFPRMLVGVAANAVVYI